MFWPALLMIRASALGMAGRAPEGLAYIEQAEAALQPGDPLAPDMAIAHGDLLLAVSPQDVSAADAMFEQVAQLAEENGARMAQLQALTRLVSLRRRGARTPMTPCAPSRRSTTASPRASRPHTSSPPAPRSRARDDHVGQDVAIPLPPTKYATTDEGFSIAYQQVGDTGPNLVWVTGGASHLELFWDLPGWAHLIRRVGSFSRLVWFDKRGTGLSDRDGGTSSLEARMLDIGAVMDAVGLDTAVLVGMSEGAAMAALFAAAFPNGWNGLR